MRLAALIATQCFAAEMYGILQSKQACGTFMCRSGKDEDWHPQLLADLLSYIHGHAVEASGCLMLGAGCRC